MAKNTKIGPVSAPSRILVIKPDSIYARASLSLQQKEFLFAGLPKNSFGFFPAIRTKPICVRRVWTFGLNGPTKNTRDGSDAKRATWARSMVIFGALLAVPIRQETVQTRLPVSSTILRRTQIRDD